MTLTHMFDAVIIFSILKINKEMGKFIYKKSTRACMMHLNLWQRLKLLAVEPRRFVQLVLHNTIGDAIKHNVLYYLLLMVISLSATVFLQYALQPPKNSPAFFIAFFAVGIPFGIAFAFFLLPLIWRLFFWMTGGKGTYQKLVVMNMYVATYMGLLLLPLSLIQLILSAIAFASQSFNMAMGIEIGGLIIGIPLMVWYFILYLVGFSEAEKVTKLRAFATMCLMFFAGLILFLIFMLLLMIVGIGFFMAAAGKGLVPPVA